MSLENTWQKPAKAVLEIHDVIQSVMAFVFLCVFSGALGFLLHECISKKAEFADKISFGFLAISLSVFYGFQIYGMLAANCLRSYRILCGIKLLFYFMYAPLISHESGEHRVSGWPVAILAGGIILPFAARGRFGLEVRTHDKTFRWKPPLVVDKASKEKIQATFCGIIAACEKSGLRVSRN